MLKTTLYRLLTFSLAILAFSSARAATITFGETGPQIDAGSMGKFTIEYPALSNANQEPVHQLLDKEVNGNAATLKYEGGGTIRMLVKDSGEVSLTFDQMSLNVKSWKVTMLIDFSYTQGGTWKFGNKPAEKFPQDKPEQPHLFGDHATTFDLTNYEGKTLSFHLPEFAYNELTDNRAWNWSIFCWHLSVPYNADQNTATFTVTESKVGGASGDGKPVFLVDQIGQSTVSGDWPGKVKSLDELKADVKDDKAYYEGLNQPTGDKFGGFPGSREKLGLKATGFFHVEEKSGKWFLSDPEGNAFFHLGVCAVSPSDDYTLVKGREQSYEWLPSSSGEFQSAFKEDEAGRIFSFHSANMIRKYGEPVALEPFQARMIERLRKWGFNSIGAFSPLSKSIQAANIPYVAHLPLDPWVAHIQAIPGIYGTWDPFDEQNVAKVQKSFASTLPARADDPLLIGYFLANEPIYEDIPKVVPTLDAGYACKKRLVQMLSDKYKNIGAFNAAWGLSAESFDQLNATPLHPQTRAASEDVHDFTGVFFEAYFKLVTDTFRKYDPHHMLIGNRFQAGTINNEQLCRISGKYMDVISFNYYTDAVDKDFLNRIQKWTGGRPMMLSEFYWTASHESGMAGGREVATQQERGFAYRNYVEQAASLGFIVGIEWFTMIDQATTGRWFEGFNGERANTGLISVSDRPWKPMVAEMMKTNDDIYAVLFGQRKPFVFDHPRFTQAGSSKQTAAIPHAIGSIKLDATTQNWPGIPPEAISGKRLVEGSLATGFEATFKLCWDENNLYVLAKVIDPTPMKNDQPVDKLWMGDAVEIFIGSEKLNEGGPLQFTDRHVMFGANGKVSFVGIQEQSACEMIVVPGVDGKSYTLEAAIPWKALAIKPEPGRELLFDLGIDDSLDGHHRSRQLMWNGTAHNSDDRTHWGRAKLQQ